MRVLVCGGRDYADKRKLWLSLNAIRMSVLIHGAAKGADTLADEYGHAHGLEVIKFLADWNKYGNSAGYIRNKQMLDEGKPDLVVAFPGGKGTAMMVKIAKEAGTKVLEIT